MAIDVGPYLDPATTAVLVVETQARLVDPENPRIPGLAKSAIEMDLVGHIAKVNAAARTVGAQIIFINNSWRNDGLGRPTNDLIRGRESGGEWSGGLGPVAPGLDPQEKDIIIQRELGLTSFASSPLDNYLRNLGIKSVVIMGMSANLAVLGTTIEATNAGYKCAVLSDCIAGDPPEYVPYLLKYTIRNIALVTTSDVVIDHWASLK